MIQASAAFDPWKSLRPDELALPGGERDAHHDDKRENVLQKGDPGLAADRAQREARNEARAETLHDRTEENEKARKDHGVQNA